MMEFNAKNKAVNLKEDMHPTNTTMSGDVFVMMFSDWLDQTSCC